MQLTTPTLIEGNRMPMTHALEGDNLSPALIWSDAPEGTKSFAITCYDPDAPTGAGWWHWCVIDIDPSITEFAQGAQLPTGARSMITDFGQPGYGGARPPAGDGMHRYIFTVWALPVSKLDVPDTASPSMVGFNLKAMALASVKRTVTFVTE